MQRKAKEIFYEVPKRGNNQLFNEVSNYFRTQINGFGELLLDE